VEGDSVFAFHLESVRRGEKSGVMGFYSHSHNPSKEQEYAHAWPSCLEKCFSPEAGENGFLYDEVVHSIRQEVYEELGYDPNNDVPLDEFDPPFCLWCKKTDTVWMQDQMDRKVYYCTACQKYWDDEETELSSAA
jgi:hypothetical protein